MLTAFKVEEYVRTIRGQGWNVNVGVSANLGEE
jgi:hypothetical protein